MGNYHPYGGFGPYGIPTNVWAGLSDAAQKAIEEQHSGSGLGTPLPARSHLGKLEVIETRLGEPITLAWGRHYVGGVPILQSTLTNGYTILLLALGDDEWDGPEIVWVNGATIDLASAALVHFHPGLDGEAGIETDPAVRNQKICSLLPVDIVYPTTFSRTAYVSLYLPPNPAAPTAAFDVRGIYRTRRVRIFDAAGAQTDYKFSANPAWQLLDAYIKLVVKPQGTVNEALTAEELARIDFAAFAAAATYCDADIGGGVKRFESNVAFVSTLNLSDILQTFLSSCRGYLLEQDGKLGLYIDQPRASVFTFDADKIVAASFEIPEKQLRDLANQVVVKVRDTGSGGEDHTKDFAPWAKTLDAETHQATQGRVIKQELDLGANTPERAERLGWYWLNRSLLAEQATLLATLDAGKLLPGDRVVAPKDHGFVNGRDWEVLEVSDLPEGDRLLFLQEYNEAIFSDVGETQQGTEDTRIDLEPHIGVIEQYHPTVDLVSPHEYTDWALAFDRDFDSPAVGFDSGVEDTPKHIRVSGFPSGFTARPNGQATLRIASHAAKVGSGGVVSVALGYSLDSGANWTWIYSENRTTPLRVDDIPLLATQDFAQVQVEQIVDWTSGSVSIYGYLSEVWIEVAS